MVLEPGEVPADFLARLSEATPERPHCVSDVTSDSTEMRENFGVSEGLRPRDLQGHSVPDAPCLPKPPTAT